MGKYKSLIKAISDAIQTGVGGNMNFNERTFLSHLLEWKRGESFFAEEKKECEPLEKHETFVITRWLIRLICKMLTWILWFFNVVCYMVVLLFKGKRPQIKSLRHIKCFPVINLAAIVIILVVGVVILVNMITVGVKDLLFAPVNMRTNSQGVITLDQPCLESHSFFLMNASTFWWPSDISVSKGDKVKISVSGSMYSDIGEVCSAADNNRHLRYSRRFFAKKNEKELLFDTIGTSICIEPDACFGELLCKITNEYAPVKTSKAQIEKIGFEKNRFKVEQRGVLYITFNDVFLTKEIVRKMRDSIDLSTVVMKEDLEETDFLKRFDSNQLEAGNEEIWFNDNAGEYLVNIRVKKNILKSNIPCYKKPVFIIYRRIEEHTMVYWIVWIVGAILFYIFMDFLVSYLLQRRIRLKQDCSKCHSKTSENASE